MGKFLTARDMILDFIDFVLIISLGTGLFYMIVVANQFSLLAAIFKFFTVLVFFTIPFLFVLKINLRKVMQLKGYKASQTSIDKIIAYAARRDIIFDWFVIFSIFFLELLLPMFFDYYGSEDLLQSFLSLVVLSAWHFFYFRPRPGYGEGVIAITIRDACIDEIFIFFLPLYLLLFLFFFGNFDAIDILQSALILALMYFWRKFFYFRQR